MFWLESRRLLACWTSLVAVILLASGCSKEELPKTFVVRGKVVKDGQPFAGGGAILFRPINDHERQAIGEIAMDGSYTLRTLALTKSGRTSKLEGTIEGEFKVQIEPPMGKGRPFWLTKTYKIEAKESNDITVVVE